MQSVKGNFVYILRCADSTLYTGWTTDLHERVRVHNAGRGAKYTKARLPVHLVYSESYETKTQAMQREYEIKQLSRAQKLKLVGIDNRGG